MDLQAAPCVDATVRTNPHTHAHTSTHTYTLAFPALDRHITCRADETVFAAARRAGLRIVGACGGRGSCGSCVVRVQHGQVQAEDGHKKWQRACRVTPRSDLVLDVAPRSLAAVVRADVHTGGEGEALPLQPAGPVLALGAARPQAPLLGLAIDLGTTNVVGWLVDLRSGQRLASLGVENPQVAWGADLVSRINHATQSPAAANALRQAALDAVAALSHDLTHAIGAGVGDVADVVVCGNTAMQHLLAGWPVAQLGRAPFVAVTTAAVDLPARGFGVAVAEATMLHLAPSVGGFVGGDHVSAMLATEPLWSQPGSTLVMDIGTNTEISLVHGGRIVSASCPSGPALEGGHIASGMRAANGAIERVSVQGEAFRLQVIGGVRPIGLCGSGVLDALAAFVRAGWIDPRGRIVRGDTADGVRAITLAAETRHVPAVRITQHDVRAVQLAKSAIRTGVQMLAAVAGMNESDITRFVIAGAFGAYISVESCIELGLLPALPRERFTQVGNAAGLGVQQMLASTERRARAARLATECRYVELSSRSDFQKTFLHQIGFPPP